jgi:hypothetical protein
MRQIGLYLDSRKNPNIGASSQVDLHFSVIKCSVVNKEHFHRMKKWIPRIQRTICDWVITLQRTSQITNWTVCKSEGWLHDNQNKWKIHYWKWIVLSFIQLECWRRPSNPPFRIVWTWGSPSVKPGIPSSYDRVILENRVFPTRPAHSQFQRDFTSSAIIQTAFRTDHRVPVFIRQRTSPSPSKAEASFGGNFDKKDQLIFRDYQPIGQQIRVQPWSDLTESHHHIKHLR